MNDSFESFEFSEDCRKSQDMKVSALFLKQKLHSNLSSTVKDITEVMSLKISITLAVF